MVNQLTKQSSENEIKTYFTEVLKLSQSEELFPVNLDDVWPLVYAGKNKAVRALKDNNLFMQGVDYQVLTPNGQNPQEPFAKNGQNLGGRPSETYLLSLPCLEFFIARKVRPVFEVYRQVFHKTAQAMNEAAKKGELTRESLTDEWGDPVIDLRLYYNYLVAVKSRKYSDWLQARFCQLNFVEGRDYTMTHERSVDSVRNHAARDYALSLRTFTELVRLDSRRSTKPDIRRRLYDLLHLLRECDERERTGRITMHEYVNTVRQRVYGLTRIRITHRRVERPGTGQGEEKPSSIYDPFPMPEDMRHLYEMQEREELQPSRMNALTGKDTSLIGTMRRIALLDREITLRFDTQMHITDGNKDIKEVYDRYCTAYGELRNAVGNLAYIEAVNQVDDEMKAATDGKEATR